MSLTTFNQQVDARQQTGKGSRITTILNEEQTMRLISVFSFFALISCAVPPTFSPEEGKAVTDACIAEVQAPGAYSVSPGRASTSGRDALPNARAIATLGGTSAGAAAINACIQRQAGA